MTKADIIEIISRSTGIGKLETEAVVRGFMETVEQAMLRGDTIELRGFGVFKLEKRKSRTARDFKNNTTLTVPSRTLPSFQFSKSISGKVAKINSKK